jgi:hypothetical protein
LLLKKESPVNHKNNIMLLVLFLFLTGCAVSTTDTIAVLPALKTGSSNQTLDMSAHLPTTVAVLPFANKSGSDFAYTVVRRTLFNHFSPKNYRMLHLQDIDNQLALAGVDTPALVAQKTPAELMAILGVDGLIYGDVTHYDKTFAGTYSQVAVGVEMRLVNGAAETVWEVKDVKRSHSGGISLTPVGLIMNALVAAQHVYGDLNLYRAADDLGRTLAEDMPEPESLAQRARPRITNVVHSGVNQYLKYGDKLEIGLEGAPGLKAVAVIDGMGVIDLSEIEAGQYVASVVLANNLNLTDIAVTGKLQDSYGQTSQWVSPYGLVNIDNTPPAVVSQLRAEPRDGEIFLDWTAPADTDIALYKIASATSETGSPDQFWETTNSDYLVTSSTNFTTRYLRIAAVDRAGNVGVSQRLAALAAPDSRYGDAISIGSAFPAVISGIYKMSPAGNPYYLRNPSRVATDGVLLIAPGVEIRVSPRASLAVMGELHVFGTGQQPVTVDDIADQGFAGFLALQSTQSVSIDGLNITGAGVAVDISAGSPLIANSSFTENAFNAISISGAARPVIRNTVISGAKASGVLVSGQAQPIFENNQFIDNQPFHLQNGSSYGLQATDNQWQPAASNMTILGEVTY